MTGFSHCSRPKLSINFNSYFHVRWPLSYIGRGTKRSYSRTMLLAQQLWQGGSHILLRNGYLLLVDTHMHTYDDRHSLCTVIAVGAVAMAICTYVCMHTRKKKMRTNKKWTACNSLPLLPSCFFAVKSIAFSFLLPIQLAWLTTCLWLWG